jgi:hypothetical protein
LFIGNVVALTLAERADGPLLYLDGQFQSFSQLARLPA